MKNYFLDCSTKNASFILVSNQLKSLGIQNSMFFLRLYDKSLQGIDPYDPKLSDDLKLKIVIECTINPWYYLREVARIPEEGGESHSFILNRGNLASIWCFLNNIDNYLVLAAQNYKTQSIISILNWAFNFGVINSNMLFFHKKPEDSQLNIRRFDIQRNLLPDYIRMKFGYCATEYSREIKNKFNNNKIDVKGGPKSKEKADLIGRGLTQEIQFFDDVEYTPFIHIILASSAPAYHKSKVLALHRNSIGCRIYSSVPGNIENECCREAMKIIDNSAKWTEYMYDWTLDECQIYIQKNSLNNIVYIEYSYKQLDKDDEWFDNVSKCFAYNTDAINREILLKRD